MASIICENGMERIQLWVGNKSWITANIHLLRQKKGLMPGKFNAFSSCNSSSGNVSPLGWEEL